MGGVYSDDLKKFPVKDLRTIDQLWLNYSNGKFGFSVQKQIWTSSQVGGKVGEFDWDKFEKLADMVGWRKNNSWLRYDQLIFNIKAPHGHFPVVLRRWVNRLSLFSSLYQQVKGSGI